MPFASYLSISSKMFSEFVVCVPLWYVKYEIHFDLNVATDGKCDFLYKLFKFLKFDNAEDTAKIHATAEKSGTKITLSLRKSKKIFDD